MLDKDRCPHCGGAVFAIETDMGHSPYCSSCRESLIQNFPTYEAAVDAYCRPKHLLEGKILLDIRAARGVEMLANGGLAESTLLESPQPCLDVLHNLVREYEKAHPEASLSAKLAAAARGPDATDLLRAVQPQPCVHGYFVYKGLSKETGKLKYIGTTTQIPADRFRWHKANGKDLAFSVVCVCVSANEMLDHEFLLVKKFRPPLNKIVKRKQNLNIALSPEALLERVGDASWCQTCLKRHVNKGYTACRFCS